jgi:hypothetical protein
MVEYICGKCKKIFNRKSSYDTHINRKKSCDDIGTECKHCHKNFSRRNNMKVHMKTCKIKLKEEENKKLQINKENTENIIQNKIIIETKYKKKTIPKTIKNKVWDKYIGKEKGIGDCYVCSGEIDSKNFECGHIVAESKGGKQTLENLRAICSCCNKSIGTMNMDVFKLEYFTT